MSRPTANSQRAASQAGTKAQSGRTRKKKDEQKPVTKKKKVKKVVRKVNIPLPDLAVGNKEDEIFREDEEKEWYRSAADRREEQKGTIEG